DHPGGVRPEVGLGQPEAPDDLARRHLREPMPLLLLRAEGEDRVHHEGALDRSERTHPESPRSSSCMMSPYATWLSPAQPYSSGRLAPNNPSCAIWGTRCFGNRPSR